MLVLGGCGFIGSHVAERLAEAGHVVVVADRVPCAYKDIASVGGVFVEADLRDAGEAERVMRVAGALAAERWGTRRVWVYLFAADMGGMGFIASHEGSLMQSNTAITAAVVAAAVATAVERLFVASSACVYPVGLQGDAAATRALAERDAWPAAPQDGYGLEKLYGEQLAMRAAMGKALEVRIARFHNVYGPAGAWVGGREKAPAAMLRKVCCLRELDAAGGAPPRTRLELWGDGSQTRTFCYITDAVDGVLALMASDVSQPVNLGSDEVVTVRDLALAAGEVAGFERAVLASRLAFRTDRPVGVAARSADGSLAESELGWRPRVPLAAGLAATHAWLTAEMGRTREATVALERSGARRAPSWQAFLDAGLTSAYVAGAPDATRFALLVPVTSRGVTRDALEAGVRALLASLRATTPAPGAPRRAGGRAWQFDIHFGVDVGDAVCDPIAAGSLDLVALVRAELPTAVALGGVTAHVHRFGYPPGSVCRMWSDMTADAFAGGAELAVLLGDDVVLHSDGWADAIADAFADVAASTGLPYGFACVAFADDAFPGFPTFPVVHRLHGRIFGGRTFPTTFRNQDADPFLFQLYRAFGAARLLPSARLRNGIGGAGDARYAKQHVPWTGDTLAAARSAAAHWLELYFRPLPPPRAARTLTLDVVVPTYRAQPERLAAILALPVPPGVSTQFTIICDRPGNAAAARVMADLQAAHADNPFVRLRTNAANIGAGPSRNAGLAESAADWVLFLDDDVVPDAHILEAYAAAIATHPRATGFIGTSLLPPPTTARQAGVHIAGVAYFWGIALANPTHTDLPWGVTANLCVRRPPPRTVEFNAAFPKTGGGEDIDFCLRARAATRATVAGSEGFVAAPAAIVTHPWWDGGVPAYSHFSGWSAGDGHLIDLFPDLCYSNVPDLAETLVLAAVAAVVAGAAAAVGAASLTPVAVVAAVAAACVAADVASEAVRQFVTEPAASCAHLPWHTRLAGVAQGILIRTLSEAGRLAGHASRGRAAANFCRRFNWFGTMWPGAPAVERRAALGRTAVRLAAAAVVLGLVWGRGK